MLRARLGWPKPATAITRRLQPFTVIVDDFESCYRLVERRDARYDGVFFTAVTTTHIYCRPSCPARMPMRANVRFYATAAAAEAAGYRPCKRCRPDAGPGSPEWNRRTDLVERATRLIADGAADRQAFARVADELGFSERHLRRLLVEAVGANPRSLARAERARRARTMIETTSIPFARVAFAAGFGSVRQFNDTIKQLFGATPTNLRRHAAGAKRLQRPALDNASRAP